MDLKNNFRPALRETLPVMTGYLVLGAGFSMIMKANGFGIGWSLAMSIFIYAGSMQYLAVSLITGGASLLSVAITTLMVNARHLFYGLSMTEPYRHAGPAKPYLIFALTDETYSLVCMGDKTTEHCLLVSLLNQIYWVTGTALGGILGSILRINTEGIDFALTALFLTVMLDQWLNTDDHFPAITGAAASLLCLLLFGQGSFLIPSMIIILTVLLLHDRKEAYCK